MDGKFNDEIKVLGYGNLSKLESMMDRHLLSQLEQVSDELTQEPRTICDLNDYILSEEYTHVIVPDENFHVLNDDFDKCVAPVTELLLDHWVPWAIERKKEYMSNNKISHAFVFSERFHEPYKGVANFHPVLCGFDTSIFLNQGVERDIDVLIHGSLGEDTNKSVYPVRNWLSQVLPKIGEQEGLKIDALEHPGYFPDSNINHQKKYSQILNKSKIAIGGSSHWRLPLKKFYEVPACGTILLSDLPMEDVNFFKGRILEIDPNRITSKKYVDVLKGLVMDTLENYEKVRERFQPFRSKQNKFDRSYQGRALEMRAILREI